MDRVQAASFMVSDRPLLGQMAIATVLVGSAAALSSAGIAVPVSQVGYAKGWDERAPAASSLAPTTIAAKTPASIQIAVPWRAPAPAIVGTSEERIGVIAPRTAIDLAERTAPMSRIDVVQPPLMTLASTVRIVSTPVLAEPVYGELAALPPKAPVAALTVPSAPVIAPSAAQVSLAASTPAPAFEAAPLSEEAKLVAASTPPLRLINPPELRGFDLARISGPHKSVPAGFARSAVKSGFAGKAESIGKKDSVVGDVVYHQVSVIVAGSEASSIDVRIGADMKPSIKVGDLLGLVSDRMDPESAARFAAASSAGDYVSLATLRAAGFDVSYNAGADRISIGVSQ